MSQATVPQQIAALNLSRAADQLTDDQFECVSQHLAAVIRAVRSGVPYKITRDTDAETCMLEFRQLVTDVYPPSDPIWEHMEIVD